MHKYLIHLSALSAIMAVNIFAAPCGTMRLLNDLISSPGLLTKTTAPPSRGIAHRTLESDHLTIHYKLRGVHKVRLEPSEAWLSQRVDSIYSSYPVSYTEYNREMAVYTILNSQDAPHPIFVQKQRDYFEAAWSYYADTVGLTGPFTQSTSYFYKAPAVGGKYHVELADIWSADPYFEGIAYMGVSLPAGSNQGALMENDFLNYSTDSLGNPRTDSILSSYSSISPAIEHNYSTQWEDGIKVTAPHELYHAFQFRAIPVVTNIHFWFEASATAMEERLAPQVNDYLQYLPSVFNSHSTESLHKACDDCVSPYGNSIFHIFLSSEFGNNFDKAVWSFLAQNQDIELALTSLFSQNNTTINTLYPKFTLPLAFTQTQNPSVTVFSDDNALWPLIQPLILDYHANDTMSISLPPLTWEVLDIKNPETGIHKYFTGTSGSALTINAVYEDNSIQTYTMENGAFTFEVPDAADLSKPLKLIISNSSWDRTTDIAIFSQPQYKPLVGISLKNSKTPFPVKGSNLFSVQGKRLLGSNFGGSNSLPPGIYLLKNGNKGGKRCY